MNRLVYALLLFAAAVSSIVLGGLIWPIALGAASLLAGGEYIAMMRVRGIHPSAGIIRLMITVFFVVAALPEAPGSSLPWNFLLLHLPLLLTAGVCLTFVRLLFRRGNALATISDIATTILGFIYLGWLPCHLVLLRNIVPAGMLMPGCHWQEPGVAYVLMSLVTIGATDTFALIFGRRFGKHPLYPQVSPKKTVEGALGGLIAATIMGSAMVFLSDHYLFPAPPFGFKPWQALLMPAVISVCAQLGDLCESLLKRDAGIKDSGNLIPGHGGFLDRGDSIILGGIVSYYWITVLVLGLW